MSNAAETDPGLLLVCRTGALVCALPVQHVVETMRPLPLKTLPGAPDFIAGVAMVRDAALPIVSLPRLLAEPDNFITRFVIVRAGTRRIGLAVDEVIGFHALSRERSGQLPPLLAAVSANAVEQIAVLDGQLLAVLATAGMVPEAVFTAIASMAEAS